MQTTTLSLSKIKPSRTNPRNIGAGKDADAELVASIKAIGIKQPPTVVKNCDGYDVVAGHRRVAAALRAGLKQIPVIISDGKDDRVWAVAENMVRAPLHPVDAFKAFRDLCHAGTSIEDIALQFGVSIRVVQQRLALGNLHDKILKAYEKDEITLQTCMAYTLADKTKQLQMFNAGNRDPWTIRRELNDKYIHMRHAEFDPKLYDGPIINDLFGEDVMATDRQKFLDLQMTWIKDEAAKLMRKKYKPLFVHIADKRLAYDAVLEIDGKKYRRDLWGDIEGKEQSEYGIVMALENDGRVVIDNGWSLCSKKTKALPSSEPELESDDPAKLTKKQHEYYAKSVINAFAKQATLEDVITFMIRARAVTSTDFDLTDPAQRLGALKHIAIQYADNKTADRYLMDTIANSDIDIAKETPWTQEFLNGYKTPQLEKLAKKLKVRDLDKLAPKGTKFLKVVAIQKALEQQAEWLPFSPASPANEKVQSSAAKKRYL